MKKWLIEKFFGLSLNTDLDQLQACVNSKEVEKGAIFFAITGKKTDGHRYLQEVRDRGASIAVIHESYEGEHFGLQLIRVQNVLDTLQSLAKWHFLSIGAKTIAVTGSVGKSTTKEFIASILGTKFRVGKTIGNQNSQIGLPLSLIALKGDEEIIVLEMGMTDPGNILDLVKIAAPDIAVLTKIDTNHIELFGSLEKIAEEKASIFSHPKTQLALIGADCLKYKVVQSYLLEKVIYAYQENFFGEQVKIGERLIGPFDFSHIENQWIENLYPALYLAKYFNMTDDEIRAGLLGLKSLSHRFEKVAGKRFTLIDDAYNTSLSSIQGAVNALMQYKVTGKKRAVIGAFVGQGVLEEQVHTELGELTAQFFDEIYCIGSPSKVTVEIFKKKGKPAYFFDSLDQIALFLNDKIQNNDLLYLKGGNRYQLWKLVDLIH